MNWNIKRQILERHVYDLLVLTARVIRKSSVVIDEKIISREVQRRLS